MRNDAPAFERFFAHSALASALRETGDRASFGEARAAAFEWFDKVPEDERSWCDAEKRALDGVA